jgi:sigma-B regulation protein RsbU (phosphoserine phosphatase)
LNRAILRQAPGETCTVAYGRLMPRRGGGATLVVSVAGHPLPLVVRRDGSVEEAGDVGTLLGAVPNPTLVDHRTELEPGDALLFYTDGLTDAYAPERIITQPELMAALRSLAGDGAAGIASGIQEALLDGGGRGPRDDLTVVVLRMPDGS